MYKPLRERGSWGPAAMPGRNTKLLFYSREELLAKMQLGRLKQINPRTVWESEDGEFTPWLAQADNLALLGEVIGLELELEATEKGVGPFRADILCKDTVSGDWVLIENQLRCTDHTHLGQLLTYAAGLRAATIVWIACPFTEEHRAALDWLNDITSSEFNFFGLEIELWQIGDSAIAPKFNVVCQPNEWTSTVRRTTGRTELTRAQKTQLKFWTAFRDYVEQSGAPFRPTKPLPQHWMSMAIGRSGFYLAAVASFFNSESGDFRSHEIRAELVAHDQYSKEYFDELYAQRDEIESELNYALVWHNPENARMCRIFIRDSVDLDDETSWEKLHEWLTVRLSDLWRVFRPRVMSLSITETGESA